MSRRFSADGSETAATSGKNRQSGSEYYCITTEWLNAPLYRIGFFPRLERLITFVTGALPRADDVGKEAALDLASDLGVLPEQKQERHEARST